MAADMFLKLGDIKGESKDKKHAGEIEILSWSWGVSNPGGLHHGTGGGIGHANFSDLNFVHYVDKSSVNLLMAAATLEHIKEATFTQRKAGKEQQEFMIMKLNDVIVTTVQDSAGGGDAPMENFSIQFAKIQIDYCPQKDTGDLDAAVSFKYNIQEKVKF